MGDLFRGYTFGATEEVTAAKLHTLVDDGTVTNIVAADFADSTITDDKIQSVGGSKFINLSAIPSAAGKIPDANISIITILEANNPVGTVRTFGVSTNPATLLGFGTWQAIAGKVIVGIDATQTEFDTLNETGGAKTVTLTSAQSGVPAHTHSETYRDNSNGGSGNPAMTTTSGATAAYSVDANTAANAAESHTNLQPYIVKYVWERTA